MAARDHLNFDLFHGTNVPFKVGDIVEPMETDSPWQEEFPETNEYAHATYSPKYAEVFADRAHETMSEDFGDESRPRIFRVRPVGRTEPDPTDPVLSRRSREGFRVVALHSERDPEEDENGFFDFKFRKPNSK